MPVCAIDPTIETPKLTRQSIHQPEERPKADVLTAAEAAVMLRISLKSVYAAVRRGEIPVLIFGRVIRIPSHALQRMLDEPNPQVRDDVM